MIKGLVNSVPANILLDTGAAATVLSKSMWDRSKNHDAQLRCVADRRLVSVQGTPLHLHGSASIQLELPPETFNITAIVADTPTADVILGRDFLRRQNCTIEMMTFCTSSPVARVLASVLASMWCVRRP